MSLVLSRDRLARAADRATMAPAPAGSRPLAPVVLGLRLAACCAALLFLAFSQDPGRISRDTKLDLVVDDAVRDLVAEGLDVALRLGTLRESSYVVRRLGSEQEIVVAAAGAFEELGELTAQDMERILGTLYKRFFAKKNNILPQAKEFTKLIAASQGKRKA